MKCKKERKGKRKKVILQSALQEIIFFFQISRVHVAHETNSSRILHFCLCCIRLCIVTRQKRTSQTRKKTEETGCFHFVRVTYPSSSGQLRIFAPSDVCTKFPRCSALEKKILEKCGKKNYVFKKQQRLVKHYNSVKSSCIRDKIYP